MADRLLRRFSSVPTLAFASAKATEEQVRAAFDAMDSDGDGVLSAEEIGGYLDRKGYGEDERQRFFRRTDQNEDGGIDYDEFKRGWTFLSTFAIANHDDGEVMRKPGSVRGLDIVIEDCQNTTIAICDHTAQVQIDSLDDCRVLIGACTDSAFVRGCVNCEMTIGARQLRTRDCRDCTFYLYCATEPVIETSTRLRFAPYNAAYPQLGSHFTSANLAPAGNLWYAVYDFNGAEPDAAEHWMELPESEWKPWILPIRGERGKDLGEPENPVPRDARAPLPKDSMRGMAMGPPQLLEAPALHRQGSRSCCVL